MPSWRIPVFGLAVIGTMSGCCDAEEQRSVSIGSPGQLTVVMGGTTLHAGTASRLSDPPANPATVQFVFNILEGSTSGEGITLTAGGNDPVTDQLVILSLALPVALRAGDVYTVGGTFDLEPSLDGDPRAFGPYDLAQPNQAEVSFNVSRYSFPPPTFTVDFRAVTSTGTVRVTGRERGRVDLQVDLAFTDAAGNTATVTGGVQAVTERYTPPCFS